LGLEAAWELCKLKLNVTVLQSGPTLLDKQLDRESAAKLQALAENKGVKVAVNVSVTGVTGAERVTGVSTKDSGEFPADIVIVSTGVKANIDAAKSAGCETDRAIIVDEHMKTNVPDIYAAGDCAEHGGVNLALWSEASEQGKIAGACAVGFDESYTPIKAAVTFNGFDSSLYSIGDVGKTAGRSYKTVTVSEDGTGRYRKLYFLSGKLCGAVSIGGGSDIAKLTADVENQAKLSDIVL